ncbi:MAG: hypothetical protein KDD11_12085 [Acidobacteria bacterium]|nr:hypothetical protein [Acidobacteriota bacterium]
MTSRSRTLVTVPRTLAGLLETLPALASLAASGRALAVLALPQHHSLLRLLPGVEATVAVNPSETQMLAAVRAAECHESIHLDASADGPWLAWRAKISRRWGYRGGLRGLLLAPAVEPPAAGPRSLGSLLDAVGAEPAETPPRLVLPPALRERGHALLERANLAAHGGPLIALAPTTDLPGAAVWPWPRYAELARALRRDEPGRRVLLLATAEELWPVVRVHEETARFFPVLGPDLDLAHLAGVVAALDLVIAAESSWGPLAAALGVAALTLVDAERSPGAAPVGDRHGILPGRRRWPPWRPRLSGVEVGEVVRAARDLLRQEAVEGEVG